MGERFVAVVGAENSQSPGGRVPFIEVPAEIVERLDRGKRPALLVSVNGHTWRSRAAVYGGRYYVAVTKAVRLATGVELDDTVDVEIAIDDAPREVELPAPLAAALAADPAASSAFDRLSHTARKEHAAAIASARQEATRGRRLAGILASLRGKPS